MKTDFVLHLYKDQRTVFTINEIAMICREPDFQKLKGRMNYYVKNNRFGNPRRGIYTKENYSNEELACKIFSPSYISMEYVLQKEGINFQYSSEITSVSYLSRSVEINGKFFKFQKIKDAVLYNNMGIRMNDLGVTIASPERAVLDALYLNKEYQFDSTVKLDTRKIYDILPIYKSQQLLKRVSKFF